jgi:hypothetical protein
MPDPQLGSNPTPTSAPATSPSQPAPLAFRHADAGAPWAAGVFTRDDLRRNATIGRFKSADDLGTAYVALEKKVGSGSRLPLPGADASEADWDSFYNSIGRPETADKYAAREKVSELQIDERFAKGAFEAFHKAGLNDAQATALTEFYAAPQRAELAAKDARTEATVRVLRNQWGRDFDSECARPAP